VVWMWLRGRCDQLIDGALGALKIVKEVMSFIGKQSQGTASGNQPQDESRAPKELT
jgi:hypothetical protein